MNYTRQLLDTSSDFLIQATDAVLKLNGKVTE